MKEELPGTDKAAGASADAVAKQEGDVKQEGDGNAHGHESDDDSDSEDEEPEEDVVSAPIADWTDRHSQAPTCICMLTRPPALSPRVTLLGFVNPSLSAILVRLHFSSPTLTD